MSLKKKTRIIIIMSIYSENKGKKTVSQESDNVKTKKIER